MKTLGSYDGAVLLGGTGRPRTGSFSRANIGGAAQLLRQAGASVFAPTSSAASSTGSGSVAGVVERVIRGGMNR